MRVTNGMLTRNFLKSLNSNMGTLDKYQMQIATNRRITKLSDDPVGVIKSMSVNVKLYKIDQYKSNIKNAQTWLKQTEDAVTALNKLVQSAYEQTLEAANDFITPEDKMAAAEYIKELRDEVLSIGNSKNGDKYIFGGYNTEKAPFSIDTGTGNILFNGLELADAANPLLIAESSQRIQIDIGFSLKADISVNGTQLLGTGADNLYDVLNGLYNTLVANGSPKDIGVYTQKLQKAQSDLLALQSEIGGKDNRMELVLNRHEEDTLNYSEIKSNIEDIDQAEVIMYYKMAEAVYNSALSVGADIIQPTLLDYLR